MTPSRPSRCFTLIPSQLLIPCLLQSANISCSVANAAANVFADKTPSFLPSRALSTVRSWSSTIKPLVPACTTGKGKPVREHVEIVDCDLHRLLVVNQLLHGWEQPKFRVDGVVNRNKEFWCVGVAPDHETCVCKLNSIQSGSILPRLAGRSVPCGLTSELTGTHRQGAANRAREHTSCGALPVRARVERPVRQHCCGAMLVQGIPRARAGTIRRPQHRVLAIAT